MGTVPILYSGVTTPFADHLGEKYIHFIVTLNTVLDREHGLPSVWQ